MPDSGPNEYSENAEVDDLIAGFDALMRTPHPGTALETEPETAIERIAQSGRAREIQPFLFQIAQQAPICVDRAEPLLLH